MPTLPENELYEMTLSRLRRECMSWPSVVETLSWGNPTFKAARTTFAVLDRYEGQLCVCIRCGGDARSALLKQSGYFAAPYDKKKLSVCLALGSLEWRQFSAVLRNCYELAMEG
jgi:predicted DNA-binding protein (MmcQ/YjbR family)